MSAAPAEATPRQLRIGVIGAGVVGLSTALKILQEFPDSVQLEILADKFETETTSDGNGKEEKERNSEKEKARKKMARGPVWLAVPFALLFTFWEPEMCTSR